MTERSAIWTSAAIAAPRHRRMQDRPVRQRPQFGRRGERRHDRRHRKWQRRPAADRSIPALVSVNLQNVLNDLSVSLKVNRNNIPVTAQVPIDVAASVCGVSVDVIAASAASGQRAAPRRRPRRS